MQKRRGASVVLAVSALFATGCAANPESTGVVGVAITDGANDDDDPAVVALLSGERPYCTGTLISPRVIVTAAHCTGQKNVRAFFGASVADGGELRDVVDQRAHPGFHALSLANDIGLMLLAEPAPSSVAPVHMRLQAPPDLLVGAAVRLVGFGMTSADMPQDTGRKREGATTVASLDALSFEFGPAPSQTCMGDSGGPAFMTFDGVEALVGVTSAGDPRCEQYGRDTRVDAYAADFVLPYVDATSAVGGSVGARCFLANNCASAMCERPEDAPTIGYCSSPCQTSADCPGVMVCDASAACRYLAPSPGAFATGCLAGANCDGRVCARPEGNAESICTARCLPEVREMCPIDTACVPEGGGESTFVCAPRVVVAGGCGMGAHGCETPAGSLVFGLSLLALAPRRRARRERASRP